MRDPLVETIEGALFSVGLRSDLLPNSSERREAEVRAVARALRNRGLVNRREDLRDAETAGEMLARMGVDGRAWAAEFRRIFGDLYPDGVTAAELDEGWLIGWFANAIEAGRSAGFKAAAHV